METIGSEDVEFDRTDERTSLEPAPQSSRASKISVTLISVLLLPVE